MQLLVGAADYGKEIRMKYSMTRMLSTLLVLTVSMILNDAHAQYKADANAILRIGNQIPLLGGTDAIWPGAQFYGGI